MHHLTLPRPSVHERMPRPSRLGRLLCVLGAVLALSACSSMGNTLQGMPSIGSLVTPYKIDIQQGNVVTREQAQALHSGMSRSQVRDILGSPLLTSVFHADRWDYVFTFKRQGQPPQLRKLALFFKGEVLERFEGDDLPTEAEFVASLDVRRVSNKPPVLQATEEQLKAFQERNTKAAAALVEPTVAPGTTYPPLETPGVAQ
ncbi:MAG: outer membrane protein assembly factor BamE [Hydrogenophaga sp.]|uniref:outer membrane protein assembly factor BamE n=1 Tax=Hydrogenophaga sp. TaxID=1904254 RepID=UPI002755F982|nr:outer membrane protein assembly factor BamE [Hydrogenophaga sp.]MDP2418076.1 outer membrane protein assembly factor BamE [Hydrogenophaga sp.]MDZ4188984.1 outer membrane protein assembly factor BamE [Hydrogenophaga sp.]